MYNYSGHCHISSLHWRSHFPWNTNEFLPDDSGVGSAPLSPSSFVWSFVWGSQGQMGLLSLSTVPRSPRTYHQIPAAWKYLTDCSCQIHQHMFNTPHLHPNSPNQQLPHPDPFRYMFHRGNAFNAPFYSSPPPNPLPSDVPQEDTKHKASRRNVYYRYFSLLISFGYFTVFGKWPDSFLALIMNRNNFKI